MGDGLFSIMCLWLLFGSKSFGAFFKITSIKWFGWFGDVCGFSLECRLLKWLLYMIVSGVNMVFVMLGLGIICCFFSF